MKLLKFNPIIFLLSLVFCFSNAFSQSTRFSIENYISPSGDSLSYRQLFPDANLLRKYPLIVFLHGSGERGKDNEAQLKWGVSNFASDQVMKSHPAFVIAPQCPENKSWSNFSSKKNDTQLFLQPLPTKPMELLIELIDKLVNTLPIDTNRIYITGLSMGGFGTFDAIQRYPNLFAAAVPVCGGGDVTKASLISHIPIWIFHGAEDPAVSPILSLDMITALTKAGAHSGFTQYPEAGHFSWLAAYTDPMMIDWLFRQHK